MSYIKSPKVRVALMILLPTLLLIGYYIFQKNNAVFRAIPLDSAIVLEINGLNSAKTRLDAVANPTWKGILEASFFSNLWKDATIASEIIAANPSATKLFAENKIVAALNLHDADSTHAVFAIDLKEAPDLEEWIKGSKKVLKSFPSQFKGYTIFTLQLSGNQRFAMTSIGNLLLFAHLPYLVEDAVTAYDNNNSIWQDKGFRSINNNGKFDIQVFVNAAVLADQLSTKMVAAWSELPEMLRKNIGWLRFDWDGKRLSSYLAPQGFLKTAQNWGGAPRGEIYTVLPNNTTLLLWAGCGNKKVFYQGIFQSDATDFQYFIAPWAGREFAYVLTEPFSNDFSDEQYLVFSVQDSLTAQHRIEAMSTKLGLLKSYDYQTFKVLQFSSMGPLRSLVGVDNTVFRNPVCAMIGKYVVFAHSPSAMELWIDKFIVNQTLANETAFLQANKNMLPQGNAMAYFNASHLSLLTKNIFTPKYSAHWENLLGRLLNSGVYAVDFSPETERLSFSNIVANGSASNTTILWKTPLAAEAITQPFVVESPKAGQPSTIVVQDARNQLYCLSSNGEIMWKRQLDGPVMSQVFGIDFYDNKTTCYLFNTGKQIWQLDPDGNDIEGFPLKLKSEATNGVTLVDYSGRGDYAFYLGCDNGNVYGFDRFGRPLIGWNPQANVGVSSFPLLHFQHNNKDFLIAQTDGGVLRAFGRDGDARFPAVQMDGTFLSPPQVDVGKASPRIVCTNANGKAYVTNFSGESFSLPIGGNQENKQVHFLFAPLIGDARKDYVALSGKNLSIYSYEGTNFGLRSKQVLPVPQDSLFEIVLSTQKRFIGSYSKSKRQIYLFNNKGQIGPIFPLAGSTPFLVTDLFKNNKSTVLVVGNGANVYAYSIGGNL